jgi:hypothetical protein
MQNDASRDPEQAKAQDPDLFLVNFTVFLPVAYAIALWQGDRGLLATLLAVWAGFAVLVWGPYAIFRVSQRRMGQGPRAAAILAFGLLPWALFLSPARAWLSTWTGLAIAFPVFYAWGVAVLFIAMRDQPLSRSPAFRAALLAGGALIYGAIAVVLLLAVIGPVALLNRALVDLGLQGLLLDGLAVVLGLAAAAASVRLTTIALQTGRTG